MSQNSKSFVKTKPEQRQKRNKQEENKQSETTNDEQSSNHPGPSIDEQLECFADLLIDELLKQML